MAKGRNHVKTAVLLPVQSKGNPNPSLVRAEPRSINERLCEIDAGSFCDAARMAAANTKPLPSY